MLVISGGTSGKRMGNGLAASWSESPDGLGPYRFVSHTTGGEIVLEVYEGYWRRMPQVKRLVMKGVPGWTTWLTMLQNGGADFALSFDGPAAEGMKRDPSLTLEGAEHASIFLVKFPDQCGAKSAWADMRRCLAVNQAPDLQAINEAA